MRTLLLVLLLVTSVLADGFDKTVRDLKAERARVGVNPGPIESTGVKVTEATQLRARQVLQVCDGRATSLNLVIAGATEVVGLRAARGVAANSLYLIEGGQRWPEARLLASEPLDGDSGWQAVDPDHVALLGPGGVECRPVDL